MPAWWVIPGIVKGTTSIANYISARRNKTPSFGATEYGKHLRTIGEQGIYSPDVQSRMLSETTRTAGNIAQGRIASTRGYLESRGIGTSIAGARVLDRPVQDVQRQVGEQANRLTIANEMSKVSAKDRYVQMLYQNQLARKQEARGDTSALLGGLAGAGVSMYQDKMAYDEQEQIKEWLKRRRGSTVNMSDKPMKQWSTEEMIQWLEDHPEYQ